MQVNSSEPGKNSGESIISPKMQEKECKASSVICLNYTDKKAQTLEELQHYKNLVTS